MNYDEITDEAKLIADTVTTKNFMYGNAVQKTADIMRVLYPNGYYGEDYKNILLITRICDKLARIANKSSNEAVKDAYRDIAGYGILGSLNTSKDVSIKGKLDIARCKCKKSDLDDILSDYTNQQFFNEMYNVGP